MVKLDDWIILQRRLQMAGLRLNDEDERLIRKQIESGRYQNISEVVRAGLKMLEADADRERWMREEIPSRMDGFRQNPEQTIGLDDAFLRLEARHRSNIAKTK